jgi:hypothetical protein
MGISIVAAAMILHEHKYRPIEGTVLTIGRQSVGLTGRQMDLLLEFHGVPKRPGVEFMVDSTTVGVSRSEPYITQETFFAAFTDASVKSLDVSAYEDADIVCDLQQQLPEEHFSYADFIFNGSCLDNIFDPAAAMRNISRLLKSNGRVYHFEQGNSHPTAYLKYSADWFMDYYALNNFADCKTYIIDDPNSLNVPLIDRSTKSRPRTSKFDLVVYSYNPYVEHQFGNGYDCSQIETFSRYEIHCLAEKGELSTCDRIPIQKHYRTDAEHQLTSTENAKRFLHSDRPLFSHSVPFEVADIPRIDSSEYPEQLRPVAVFLPGYLAAPPIEMSD